MIIKITALFKTELFLFFLCPRRYNSTAGATINLSPLKGAMSALADRGVYILFALAHK